MTATLDSLEAEKTVGGANDAQIPVESGKENDEPAEKKKGTNGFLVSLAEELMVA